MEAERRYPQREASASLEGYPRLKQAETGDIWSAPTAATLTAFSERAQITSAPIKALTVMPRRDK